MPNSLWPRLALAALAATAIGGSSLDRAFAQSTAPAAESKPACKLGSPVLTIAPSPQLVRQKTAFAMSLLSAIADGKSNVAVSPFGVEAVLASLDLGADRTMKAAIARTLNLRGGRNEVTIEAIRKDARILAVIGNKTPSPFSTANGIFLDQKLPLTPGVEERIEAEGGIAVDKLDFASAEAIAKVNRWASDHTGGRIPSVLDPGESPAMVAINAFAFKDCWRVPFDPKGTSPQPFQRLDGTSADRPTMKLDDQKFAYGVRGRFAALELPYADDRFAITFVTTTDAPAAPQAFAAAGDLLLGAGLRPTDVTVSLPKFGGLGEHDLLAMLSKLGLAPGLASKTQLSGFASGVALSAVRQKTFIAVDEAGTEAAAATTAIATRSAFPLPKTVAVKFDRPFVYALRHKASGTILMTGYVADPQSAP